jgi:hypothetical protein
MLEEFAPEFTPPNTADRNLSHSMAGAAGKAPTLAITAASSKTILGSDEAFAPLIGQMLASCESLTFFSGNSRTRLPLAAKMALAIAGAIVAVPHSPMPPHFAPPDGTR